VLVTEYGCFVELRPEVWGLFKRERWRRPLAAGDWLQVCVEHMDPVSHKVEVSEPPPDTSATP
jgi:hypothetical protein